MLELTIDDNIAHVRPARPDRQDALNGELMEALGDAARSIAEDPTVRAVVLSGRGRSSRAGLDMANFADDD